MTWIDVAVLITVILSAAFSMVRGFVREILAVFAWIGAFYAGAKYYGLLLPEMNSILPATMKNFAIYGAFAAIFLIVLIVLSLVSALIGGLVQDSALSGLDRSLGLVFGALRGALIVCAAYIALSMSVAQAQWPAPVVNARFLPIAYQGAKAIVGLFPKQYQPKVDPLPGPPAPSAAKLMQQPVAGSALQ